MTSPSPWYLAIFGPLWLLMVSAVWNARKVFKMFLKQRNVDVDALVEAVDDAAARLNWAASHADEADLREHARVAVEKLKRARGKS